MVREHAGSYTASRFPNGAATGPEDPLLTDFMDYYFVRKSESYKFIRMADDLHDVATYLNEMRICFLLLTGTVYIILAIYFISWCIRRNRRRVQTGANNASGNRRRWGELQGAEYENALTAQTNVGQTSDDLASVRSDGALPKGAQTGQHGGLGAGTASQFGMAGRGGAANRQAPSFMRHSGVASAMQNHSAAASANAALLGSTTTRLMADTDTGTVTKQQHLLAAQLPATQPAPPPSIAVLHHHHHSAHAQPTVHQSNQQQQQQQQHESLIGVGASGGSSSSGRPPGCLLNNIVEEKESVGSSGSINNNNNNNSVVGGTSAINAATPSMSTFGWRSKEKVILERHELQPMSTNGGGNEV